MNRFFIQPEYIKGTFVQFPPELSHQIINVLRLKEGELVAVLDNTGTIYEVEIGHDPTGKLVVGHIVGSSPVAGEPKVAIELCVGLSHRDKFEWILQKGTEVGVSTFSPFVSSRTLVQSSDLKTKRRDRWESIIREAAEQSGRGKLPRLMDPVALDHLLNEATGDKILSLFAWEGAGSENPLLTELVKGFSGDRIRLFVGPEGGFSEEEAEAAHASGCRIVSLGNRILRMETAAILFPGLVVYLVENPCQF